jgi:hypothetical protein
MSLQSQPPKYTSWSSLVAPIRKGERGWRAFAVQCVIGVNADGIFGDQTFAAAKEWQRRYSLFADGVIGPKTQSRMLEVECAKIDARYTVMPDGLLDGFCRVEGADSLAATNWYTPPGGRVGVDCGPPQIRIYQLSNGTYPLQSYKIGDDTMYGLRDVFNPAVALTIAARSFTGRISNYRTRRPSMPMSTIVEMAVLAHNAPFLADQVIRNGRLSTPNAIAGWTIIPVAERANYGYRTSYTHAEWAKEYPRRVLDGVRY